MPIRPPKSPLRVLLWAPRPPPPGGVGYWTERYLNAAPEHDLAVTLLNTAPPPGRFDEKSVLRLDRSLSAVRALGRLVRTLATQRFDVAHVTTTLFWATPREALVLKLCRSHKIPTVLHIHASSQLPPWRDALPPLRRKLLDATLQQADVLAVLSREFETYLRAAFPTKTIVRIPNMLDLQTEAQPNVLPPRKLPRVLFVGMRTPMKGLGELAEAMLMVDAELVVVGPPGTGLDAAAEARMDDAMAKLRATGRLVETGQLSPQVCAQVYREVDVFCLPTHREGLPNVLLEAMAAGLPVVATPIGGIPDVLTPDFGILVPVDAVPELASALQKLIADGDLRNQLGRAGQAFARDHFTPRAVVSRWRRLYETLKVPTSPGENA